MKKVIFLLTLFFALTAFHDAKASHIAGADISYVYIGDSTGIPFNYMITVRVYRDTEGIPLGNGPLDLTISSTTCGESRVKNFPLIPFDDPTSPFFNPNDPDGGGYIPGYEICGDSTGTDKYRFAQFLYQDTVILSGPCVDWRFTHLTACCRNSDIDNLADLGTGILVVGKLNNTAGPNNSAQFNTPAVKLFCKNKKFDWSQGAGDPDQSDELLFSLANPLGGPAPDGTLLNYNPGYSFEEPMTTQNGFTMNSKTGVVTFTPIKKEFIVFKMIVQDFRYDPGFGDTVLVGEVMREIQIPIENVCGSENSFATGPRIDVQAFGQTSTDMTFQEIQDLLGVSGIDTSANPPGGTNANPNFSLRKVPIINSYSCFDTSVVIQFNPDFKAKCSSIDPTDFRIIGPDSILRPVVRVNKNCDGYVGQTATDRLELILEKPFDVNGQYILYTKRGNDGNVVTDECGFELGQFFLMLINVSDCPPLIYNMENVTVEQDQRIKIDWKVNPEYFAKGAASVFSAWSILKRNASAGGDFYPQEYVKDPTLRSWTDTFVTEEDVDLTRYEYAVQLIQNGEAMPATPNAINNIVITNELVTSNELKFDWTSYNGWANPQFQFYFGEFDTISQSFNWQPDGPLANSLTHTFLLAQNIPSGDSSLYGFKVEAESLDSSITYISESNWMYIDFRPEIDSIPDSTIVDLGTPYVPNVFTPNGDGFDDTFWVSLEEGGNFRQYPEISISVYNRWGQLVYENADFNEVNNRDEGWDGTDINSGQKLADGVYYYVINMSDPDTFTEKNYQGHVTIFKNGQ